MHSIIDGCGHGILTSCCVVRSTVLLATYGCIPHLSCTISWLIENDFLETDVPTCIILCVIFISPDTTALNALLPLRLLSNARPKLSLLETSITPVPRYTYLMTIFGPSFIVSSLTTTLPDFIFASPC